MGLTITETTLLAAEEAANAGNTSEAWQILADAGDLYAASARDIIEQIGDYYPASVFTKIVKVQWARVSPGALQTVFMNVGLQHLTQYLERVRPSEAAMPEGVEHNYILPTTRDIEDSYRQAVTDHGLPALTAVDSMFSVLDWNMENSDEWVYAIARLGNTRDITWSSILDPELEESRVVYDSDVFLNDNIQPLKEIFLTAAAVRFLYGSYVSDELVRLVYDAFGDVVPQMFGLEDPQAVALSAALLATIDNSLTDSDIGHLLDAITLGDEDEEDRRGLQWLMSNYHRAVYGADPQEYTETEELFDAAVELINAISADPSLQYSITDLTVLTTNQLESLAAQDDVQGRACRYALVNLQPFALLQQSSQTPAPDALGEDYDLDQFSEQYLHDRSLFLYTLNQFYLTDESVNADRIIEFRDVDTDQLIMTQNAGDHVSQRYYFGDDQANNYTGGADHDHLYGGDGDDTLSGEVGNDYLEGNAGSDTLDGGEGDDELHGGAGNDRGNGHGLFGGAGEDALYGEAGDDYLEGGEDRDLLVGGYGRDELHGGDAIDILYGDNRYFDEASGEFALVDDGESDRLEGGAGDEGNDTLTSGGIDGLNAISGILVVNGVKFNRSEYCCRGLKQAA